MSQYKTDLPDNEPNPAAPEAIDETAGSAARDTHGQPQAPDETRSTTAPDGVDEAAGDDAATDDVEALRAALEQKQEEAERLRDQALRAAAEADNARKRAQRDVDAARKFALEKFARELLGVRDSLEMGLKAGADEQADLAKVVEGMELTNRMLASAMEKFGIEVVNPQGEAFDPELHEAVSTQETDEHAANSVVTVIQKGYTLNGRVLRAAMVVVAQAPGGKA